MGCSLLSNSKKKTLSQLGSRSAPGIRGISGCGFRYFSLIYPIWDNKDLVVNDEQYISLTPIPSCFLLIKDDCFFRLLAFTGIYLIDWNKKMFA